nr:hypothetical protein [uncultured Agathobaculum sp.]
MRSLDPLEKKHSQPRKLPPPPEDMEEELEQKPFEAINTAASIFDQGLEKRFGGINTAPSIFDRGAVFRTRTSTDKK